MRLEAEAGGGLRGVQTRGQPGQIQDRLEIIVQHIKRAVLFFFFGTNLSFHPASEVVWHNTIHTSPMVF
jgi:hypothetical protein